MRGSFYLIFTHLNMVQMIRIIFILIYFFIIPDYCIGQQTSFELFKYANNEFEEENYIESLDKLGSLKNQLGSSNAVIENLRVKCYYELGQYDNAEKSLNEFFKYKAADYLVEEMLAYAQQIQDQKRQIQQKRIEKLKTVTKTFFQDWASELETHTKEIQQELGTLDTKIKYAPYVALRKEDFKKQLNGFQQVFKEGRVYTLGKNVEGKNLFIVFYDDRFIWFILPEKKIINLLNKNTIGFSSQDALNTLSLGASIMHAPRLRSFAGNREMYFFVADWEGPFIGGVNDEIIQRTFYEKAKKQFDLYYLMFLGNNFVVTAPNTENYFFTPKYADEIINPRIATGVFNKYADFNLVGTNELLSEIKSLGFSHVNAKDLDNNAVLNFEIKTSSHVSILAPKKSISYEAGGKCCFNIKITKSSGVVKKVDGMQYFTPSNKKSYYSFMQIPDPYNLNTNINITGIVEMEQNTDSAISISKEEFDSLFKTFNQYHGKGAIRTFNSENYTLPYDLIKRISDGN